MKEIKLLFSLFLLVVGFSALAQTDELGDNPIRTKLFYYIDSEGDGTISLQELEAVDPFNDAVPAETRKAAEGLDAQSIFNQVDTDKNGYVTRQEFIDADIPGFDQAYGYLVTYVEIIPVRTVHLINEADYNMDRKITKDELVKFEKDHGSDDGEHFFNSLDIDGNGYLDEIEYGGLAQKIQILMSEAYVVDPSN